MTALTDRERELLDFEKEFWRHSALRDQAIRDRFNLTPTRYTQTLLALARRPEALAYAPAVVKRLQRRVTARRARTMTT